MHTLQNELQAPFPWFGGKARVADLVWERFGNVENYVEPFFGSGAVLLNRPNVDLNNLPLETINDKDGFIVNFWRAIQYVPDEVAHWADYPSFENDLHARHYWLVQQLPELAARLEGDPDYYDAKIAGWWVWGINLWIGGGWCSGQGPWRVVDGQLVRAGSSQAGVERRRLDIGSKGVHRRTVANGLEVSVQRKRPHLGNSGQGMHRQAVANGLESDGFSIYDWFEALSRRLRRSRVASGDWSRIVTPAVLMLGKRLTTGIFLDPPYSDKANRNPNLYREESLDVALDVRAWALEHGSNPLLRIALCGYEGEHDDELLEAGWQKTSWTAHGGYGNNGKAASQGKINKNREVVWFSPYCLHPNQLF